MRCFILWWVCVGAFMNLEAFIKPTLTTELTEEPDLQDFVVVYTKQPFGSIHAQWFGQTKNGQEFALTIKTQDESSFEYDQIS